MSATWACTVCNDLENAASMPKCLGCGGKRPKKSKKTVKKVVAATSPPVFLLRITDLLKETLYMRYAKLTCTSDSAWAITMPAGNNKSVRAATRVMDADTALLAQRASTRAPTMSPKLVYLKTKKGQRGAAHVILNVYKESGRVPIDRAYCKAVTSVRVRVRSAAPHAPWHTADLVKCQQLDAAPHRLQLTVAFADGADARPDGMESTACIAFPPSASDTYEVELKSGDAMTLGAARARALQQMSTEKGRAAIASAAVVRLQTKIWWLPKKGIRTLVASRALAAGSVVAVMQKPVLQLGHTRPALLTALENEADRSMPADSVVEYQHLLAYDDCDEWSNDGRHQSIDERALVSMKNTPRWYRLNHLGNVDALADRAGRSVELAASARYASYYDCIGRPNCCYAFAKRKTTHDQYVVYQQNNHIADDSVVFWFTTRAVAARDDLTFSYEPDAARHSHVTEWNAQQLQWFLCTPPEAAARSPTKKRDGDEKRKDCACPHCAAVFGAASDLAKHVRTVHEKTEASTKKKAASKKAASKKGASEKAPSEKGLSATELEKMRPQVQIRFEKKLIPLLAGHKTARSSPAHARIQDAVDAWRRADPSHRNGAPMASFASFLKSVKHPLGVALYNCPQQVTIPPPTDQDRSGSPKPPKSRKSQMAAQKALLPYLSDLAQAPAELLSCALGEDQCNALNHVRVTGVNPLEMVYTGRRVPLPRLDPNLFGRNTKKTRRKGTIPSPTSASPTSSKHDRNRSAADLAVAAPEGGVGTSVQGATSGQRCEMPVCDEPGDLRLSCKHTVCLWCFSSLQRGESSHRASSRHAPTYLDAKSAIDRRVFPKKGTHVKCALCNQLSSYRRDDAQHKRTFAQIKARKLREHAAAAATVATAPSDMDNAMSRQDRGKIRELLKARQRNDHPASSK